MSPKADFVRMTPAFAAKLLDRHNSHNRGVTWARVLQYTEDIKRGRWLVNGEAIKIDVNEQILDGQHRLMAICEADMPVITLLVTGLDPASQESMDQGKPRGFHDVLKLRGEKDPNVLAAATKQIATYERDGIPFARGFAPAVSNQRAATTLERNPEIRDACKLANKLRKPWMPTSNMAALYFLMSTADQDLAGRFFEQLSTGEAHADSPVLAVREQLVTEHLDEEAPRAHLKVRMVYVVKAWNATYLGEPLGDLRWGFHDPFPGIAGLA